MRIALALGLLLAVTISPAAVGQIVRIDTCFEEALAALRLSQLEQGIAHCDQVIDDNSAPADRRGQAFAQRGLMYARQWSIIGTTGFATQAIADITNSFRLHTPAVARKHQLLLVRAQLYAATGQTRRASVDFTAILNDDPNNAAARSGRDRLGSPEAL
jgi:hypothetical protein